MALSESEEKKRRELYDKGLNDREIAERIGVHQTTITAWRHRNNLPPNQKRGSPQKHDYDKIKELYDKGMNDKEIAKKLDIPRISVWRIRNQVLELPSIKKKMRRQHLSLEEEGKRYKLWIEGYTDKQIAEKLDVSSYAIQQWRKRKNLEVGFSILRR